MKRLIVWMLLFVLIFTGCDYKSSNTGKDSASDTNNDITSSKVETTHPYPKFSILAKGESRYPSMQGAIDALSDRGVNEFLYVKSKEDIATFPEIPEAFLKAFINDMPNSLYKTYYDGKEVVIDSNYGYWLYPPAKVELLEKEAKDGRIQIHSIYYAHMPEKDGWGFYISFYECESERDLLGIIQHFDCRTDDRIKEEGFESFPNGKMKKVNVTIDGKSRLCYVPEKDSYDSPINWQYHIIYDENLVITMSLKREGYQYDLISINEEYSTRVAEPVEYDINRPDALKYEWLSKLSFSKPVFSVPDVEPEYRVLPK